VNNALLIPAKALTFTPDSGLLKDYTIEGEIAHKGSHKKTAVAGNAPQALHNVKTRKDSTGIVKQRAFVWILTGKKLVRTKIDIGLNDNTHVEVLSGLKETDMVVTGISGGAISVASAAPGASPFLPRRGGGGGARGGGGGGGTGGARTR
jgi:HlyD family secretion protein